MFDHIFVFNDCPQYIQYIYRLIPFFLSHIGDFFGVFQKNEP